MTVLIAGSLSLVLISTTYGFALVSKNLILNLIFYSLSALLPGV